MYAAPNPADTATRTSRPMIGAIFCGAFLLFLLAAAIVLPIYTPTKSTILDPDSGISNLITMVANDGSTSTSRRKRAAS
ncbi:unnamed protein product [Rotaria sp. Silwood2]|nr:unnamed protein product [Rotaria sp. Silwood2]CAF4189073.1 unnamed protein product [Rotaria sp. Silwood2]